jgi:hypothetical protein
VLLIIGLYLRFTALVSAFLLLSFALSMTLISGVKAPFDYSVFTAASAAILLYLFLSNEKSLLEKKELKK